jgi:flagellar biogenesis protein FliO
MTTQSRSNTSLFLTRKGKLMHGLVRSAVWLAAVGLVATFARRATAEYPDRYGQTPPNAAYPQETPREAPSPWPAELPPTSDTNPPRPLAPQDAAPRPLASAPRGAEGFPGKQVSAESTESKIPPQPIPLSREGVAPSSPLGPGDLPPLASTAASLGIVLGLFLLVAWAVRRGMPKGAGLLPSDAVEVLGRAPLIGRQPAYLVRCGNKIVLVTVTPSGTQTLAEISDPAEVDRLQTLCQGSAPAGSLRGWLGQFTHPARGSNYRARADELDFRHLELGQRSS